MSLIIFGKDVAEWISLRKQLVRSGNSLSQNTEFQEIQKLASRLLNIDNSSVQQLTSEVFIPLFTHYLSYSQKEYQQKDKQVFNKFLKETLEIMTKIEIVKPQKKLQECLEVLLTPSLRYYKNTEQQTIIMTDDIAIPLTNDALMTIVENKKEQSKEDEYWISDSEEQTGTQVLKIKSSKKYSQIFLQLIQKFLSEFVLASTHPNHSFFFYISLLKQLKNNKILYKSYLETIFFQIRKAIAQKIANISEDGLKQDSLQNLIAKDGIFAGLSKSEEKKYIFGITFTLFVKLINSINIHNRLKGCSLLSEFCEQIYYDNKDSDTVNFYARKIVNQKVIQKIFTMDANEQILAKSQKMFQFMVRSNSLSNTNLKQILHLAFKGNLNQRKIVLGMIDKVIIRFSHQQVKTITDIIFSVSINELTIQMIKLVFTAGRYIPQNNNFETTWTYFWDIISDSDRFYELRIECKNPVIQNFVLLIQKGIQLGKISMQESINMLSSMKANYMMFQILVKFIRALPDTQINDKYSKLKFVKFDALKYLVENVQYQNTLLKMIQDNPTLATDEYISFLTTMIEGYRPFRQQYLGVQILTNLTNRPVMFQTLLPFYKSELQDLFSLLVTGQISNILQFNCLKIVFTTIHKLEENKGSNPHTLQGFDLIFGLISASKVISVKQQAAIFCVQIIYQYYNGLDIQDRKELQGTLVDNVIKNLQKSQEQNQKIGWMIMIQQLLNQTQIQGVGILKSHGNLVATKFVNIIVTNETFLYSHGNRDTCIRINSNSCLYQLLQKIAFQFKTNPEELKLLIDYNQIKVRYNGKTIQELHLVGSPLIARSQVESKIQRSPLLSTNQKGIRVLTIQASQAFSQVFYRFACKNYIGKSELETLMKAATDDEYDYDVQRLIHDFDTDGDGKLGYFQFMDWMLDNSKFRENQVRKMLQNLRYRPDLSKFGSKKTDYTKSVRYYLFKNETIYPILFKNIQSPNKQISDLSTKLLIRLPTYKTSVKWLSNIKTENEFILWYQLLLIQYILERRQQELYSLICESNIVEEWTQRFLTGQFTVLLDLIQNLLGRQMRNQESQSIYLALKIICKLSLIPPLNKLGSTITLQKSKMIRLDQKKIQAIYATFRKISINAEYFQVFIGLFLHHFQAFDFNEYLFGQNIELRRLASNYLYLHRKLYGKKQDILKKYPIPDNCQQFYQVIMRQMQEDPTLYEGICDYLLKNIQTTQNKTVLCSMIRLLECTLLLSPWLYSQNPNIQKLLLSRFKQIPPSSLVSVYNILYKTELNSLIPFIISYIEPINPTDRVPMINNNSQKFVGLKNLGCICYMNAMLQQLFMTKQFTNSITKYKCQKQAGILYQLQKMFNYLQTSQRLDYNPKQFCYAFDKDIKLHVQQDTEEFLNKLFDRLETDCPQLKEVIEKQFVGKTIAVRHCVCGAVVTRQQKFSHLTLEVRDCHTLNQSLTKFIQPEIIPDVYCQSCKAKKQISRRTYIQQLPQTLIIHLQRMTFNLQTLVRIKLHNYLEFPNQVDFKPFIYDPQKDSRYQLKGVVIHTGNPDAGHYYSLIKLRQKWFKFDDSHILQFNSEFNKECYGGEYDYGDYDVKSSKNAYILVYEKKKQTQNIQIRTQVKLVKNQQCGNNFSGEIQKDNLVLERQIHFFNKDFSNFIESIIRQPYIPKTFDKSVSLSKKTQQSFKRILDLIRRFIELSTQVSQNLYNKISQVVSVLLAYQIEQQYTLQWISNILATKQSYYRKMTECPDQWIRKVHKLVLLRLIEKQVQRNTQIVSELLTFFFSEKPFQKIQVHKAAELFELCLGLIMSNKNQEVSLCQMTIKLTFEKIVNFVYEKLEKHEKHKIIKLKILLLDIIILSQLEINSKQSILQQPPNILRTPKFYQRVIQQQPTIIERLSLLAVQYCYNNQQLTESLLCLFMSKSPQIYSYAVSNFLSIKDDYHMHRIQIIFGVPQRTVQHNPLNYSLKSASSPFSNIITYAPFNTSYKTLLQFIHETSNYPNKDTTTSVQLLLNTMLYYQDVMAYVCGISPCSYRFSSVLDVIYEYLKKMKEINDRRHQIISNLFYRVQQERIKIFRSVNQKIDTVILQSLFPFVIIGNTVKTQKQTIDIFDQQEGKIVIQKFTLYTYAITSQPTIQRNLGFQTQNQQMKKELQKCFFSQQKNLDSQQSYPEAVQQNNQNSYGPQPTLVVLKSTSNCPFKLILQNQFLQMKFLVTNSQNYINIPWSLSGQLSIGVQVNEYTNSHCFNINGGPFQTKKLKFSNQEASKMLQEFPESTLDNLKKDEEKTFQSERGVQMIEGISCPTCTYLNLLTAQKCEVCESGLF